MANSAPGANGRSGRSGAVLAVGAIGIVFGDIGTSPLYAVRSSFSGSVHDIAVTQTNVLGLLSLVLWALIIVVSIKYLAVVTQADNDGEGGILALTALIKPHSETKHIFRWVLVAIGLFGTALLYGDGVITPAISVLSAVEGMELVNDRINPLIVPIAVVILVGVFAIQRRGTSRIGHVFGPVMLVWFATIAVLGVIQIVQEPGVLAAFNPVNGFRFFQNNGVRGFFALGSVVLVVTGGEALYADLGHFGRRPITAGWYIVVFPALVLNYLGQGALLIGDPSAILNPFYSLVPRWGRFPLVLLATFATVIASQALISGAFSLTKQASQLGYLPKLKITHTSAAQRGQIYVPVVNWSLMVLCIGLVLGFRSSANLAAAYGVAVTMTMGITTVLFFAVAVTRLNWSVLKAGTVCAGLLVVDLAFLVANISKIPHGGWFPILIALALFTIFTTWQRGRKRVTERLRESMMTLTDLSAVVEAGEPSRLPGTAVYLFSVEGHTPPALQSLLRHERALHERVIVLSVRTAPSPRVEPDERLRTRDLGNGIERINASFGFMETPDIPSALRDVLGDDDVTYVISSESIVADGLTAFGDHLFAFVHRNATPASSYYKLPADQTVGITKLIEL